MSIKISIFDDGTDQVPIHYEGSERVEYITQMEKQELERKMENVETVMNHPDYIAITGELL